ncbi:hypothetical protein XHV734_2200 [Xanthomonas hortorum pv. vitians]|nr:hypothetical protein XHV734_2200 [Xanthomonas hortorum pv. vitians]
MVVHRVLEAMLMPTIRTQVNRFALPFFDRDVLAHDEAAFNNQVLIHGYLRFRRSCQFRKTHIYRKFSGPAAASGQHAAACQQPRPDKWCAGRTEQHEP